MQICRLEVGILWVKKQHDRLISLSWSHLTTLVSVLRERPMKHVILSLLSFVWAPVICPLCKHPPVLSAESFGVNFAVFTIDSTERALVLPDLQDTQIVFFKKKLGGKGGKKKTLWSVTKLFLWGKLWVSQGIKLVFKLFDICFTLLLQHLPNPQTGIMSISLI